MTNKSTNTESSSAAEQILIVEAQARMAREIEELRGEIAVLRAQNMWKSMTVRSLKRSIRANIRRAANSRYGTPICGPTIRYARRARTRIRSRGQRPASTSLDKPAPVPTSRIEFVAATPSRRSLLVLAHGYPVDGSSYAGQPLARRVPYYLRAGFDVTVFVPSRDGSESDAVDPHGARVVSAPLDRLGALAAALRPAQVAVHSPTPELWAAARPIASDVPTHVWMHGFESRNWRRLMFDFSAEEIANLEERLDGVNVQRQETLREIFADADISKVFVSEHMRSVGEDFAGIVAKNGRVIHNIIDTNLFPFREKSDADRLRIVSIRSFERRNYGTDLLAHAVSSLANRPWFNDLSIRIIGDGRHHAEDTTSLQKFANVSIDQRFIPPAEVAGVLATSGIALLPTRWDTQGMMMGEAMAAGVVPVTNDVAAIPEFLDSSSGKLAAAESFEELAEGIAELVEKPEHFHELSHSGRARVVAQCGPNETVAKEIELFEAGIV